MRRGIKSVGLNPKPHVVKVDGLNTLGRWFNSDELNTSCRTLSKDLQANIHRSEVSGLQCMVLS